MADERLLAAIADACLGRHDDDALGRDLPTFLAGHAVAPEDAAALQGGPPRLALYRRLVRNTISGVVHAMLPRTRARMNALAGGAFDATLDAFLAEVGPRTHYLRDVPHELLAWAAPRWRARADVPAYLEDLAAHELAEFAVSAAPSRRDAPKLAEVALHRRLVLTDAHRLVRLRHAVHELPAALDDRSAPPSRATALLVYRDEEHRVRFLELTPFAATLVASLGGGQTLEHALCAAASAHEAPLDDALLAAVARLLEDLGARGVVLGAPADGDG